MEEIKTSKKISGFLNCISVIIFPFFFYNSPKSNMKSGKLNCKIHLWQTRRYLISSTKASKCQTKIWKQERGDLGFQACLWLLRKSILTVPSRIVQFEICIIILIALLTDFKNSQNTLLWSYSIHWGTKPMMIYLLYLERGCVDLW